MGKSYVPNQGDEVPVPKKQRLVGWQSPKQKAYKKQKSHVPNPVQWECAACTLLNDPAVTKCAVCGKSRKAGVLVTGAGDKRFNGWYARRENEFFRAEGERIYYHPKTWPLASPSGKRMEFHEYNKGTHWYEQQDGVRAHIYLCNSQWWIRLESTVAYKVNHKDFSRNNPPTEGWKLARGIGMPKMQGPAPTLKVYNLRH